MNFHSANMDYVGRLWLVVLCSRLIRASAMNGMIGKGESNTVGNRLLGYRCVCMGYSRYIHHFGHIYGKIEEQWERKGY